MKRVILFLILFSIPFSVLCQENESFLKGVQAYEKLEFKKASALFQNEIDSSGITGELAFNMGNCFYRLKDYGRAVLWYKKAEKYMFKDPDLDFNLGRCYEKLSIKKSGQVFFTDYIFFLKKFFTESFINKTALFFEIVLVLTLVFFSGKRFFWFKSATFFLFILFFANSVFNFISYNFYRQAIAVNKTEVLSAYSKKASILFTIPEGSKIRVQNSKKGFFKIITKNGQPGWVAGDDIGII